MRAAGADAELVGAAALSAEGAADIPWVVWQWSETMLTLCMVMLLFPAEVLVLAPAALFPLLDWDSFTCPVMETV